MTGRDRTPILGAWELILPALALAAAAIGAILLLTRAGDPPTLARVATDPGAYDGRAVEVRGEVAHVPQTDDGAFLLTGDHGERVLVVPSRGAELAPTAAGDSVEVAGTVRDPRPAADERRPEQPPVTRADLLGRTGSTAVIEAERVSAAGGAS